MRVRTLWVIATLTGVAALSLVIAFVEAPQLRVRAVSARVPAGDALRASDVLAAARVSADANLWLLDTGAMRRRIDALPYVRDVDVRRSQFPAPSIVFDVTERVPSGCVRTGGRVVTIDATARILQTGCAAPALPFVDAGTNAPPEPGATLTAPDIDRLLADAKTIGTTLAVRTVRRDRFGGLEAVDASGVTVRFGADDDLIAKLALIDPIRRSTAGGPRPRAIDVRAPATPVVEFP